MAPRAATGTRSRFSRQGLVRTVSFFVILAVTLGLPAGSIAVAGESKIGWIVKCEFVRHLPDDPIVFPADPGASHLHAFFGARTTDANSTYRSLRASETSCRHVADTGAYWIPAAYAGDQLLEPFTTDFYYRVITRPRGVKPFPKNLRIIAGDAHATDPQSRAIVYWDCEDGGDDTNRDHPVDCDQGFVEAHVRFPDCWDGRHVDSADHKSHMAYSTEGPGPWNVCPPRYPVPVPRLIYKLVWPLHDGTRISLSSGEHMTLHADFINAWRQRALKRFVVRCINDSVNCGVLLSG